MEREGRVAGGGFVDISSGPIEGYGICERQDDVCATAYLYCEEAQAVARIDPSLAVRDIACRDWEQPSPFEPMLEAFA